MFIAIVLAGERSEKNVLLEYAKVNCKSLIKINGKPMLMHVLDALLQAKLFDDVFVIGPNKIVDECPEIKELVVSKKIKFYEQKISPAESVLSVFDEIDENKKIIITTSDNVLLKVEWLEYFCNEAVQSNKDVLMAVNDFKIVQSKYPESKRTVLKFKDISFCFCNLFAIMNKEARQVVNIWRKVETLRKKPLKIAKMFMSFWGLILFSIGALSSKDAFNIMSKKMSTRVGLVNMPFPEACIDVDKVDDLILVKKILS